MSIRKVGGIGTRKDGSGGFKANLGEGAKFITLECYAADNMADSSYKIKKGDAVVLEYNTGTGYQITIGSTQTNVLDHFGFANVGRLLDAAGRNTSGAQAGATGTAADLSFIAGIAAETKTISKDKNELISVQVWGRCEGVNVESSVAVGDRLVGSDAAANTSIGRLVEVDTVFGGSYAQAEQITGADAAPVGLALTAASSNTCTVWLLDPLQLAN